MYMSLRRYKVDPAKADALFETVESQFTPVISAMPGYVSYYIFDSGDGVVGSLSVFQDRASVDASNVKAAEWVQGALSEFNLSPVDVTEGEIRSKH